MADQYYVMVGSDQVGPITGAEVTERATKGEIDGSTLIWHPGMDEWKAIAEAEPELLGEPEIDMESTMHVSNAPAAAPEPVAEPVAAEPVAEPVVAEPVVADPEPVAAQPVAAAAPAREPAPENFMDDSRTVVQGRWESHGTVFEILRTQSQQMAKVTLSNNTCILEGGAMHYVRGPIEIEVPKASVKGFMKSALAKEGSVRPRYTGSGEVYLEPTLGELTVMELNNEEWVLDKGAFLASDEGIEVGLFTNKAISGLLGGEGMFQTKVSGTGKVLFTSDGPCERIELTNDRLMVDGSFAVARSAGLNFSVQKATKGLISSMRSGEGLVNVLEGTGSVYLAPVANRYQKIFKRIGLIQMLLAAGGKRR